MRTEEIRLVIDFAERVPDENTKYVERTGMEALGVQQLPVSHIRTSLI